MCSFCYKAIVRYSFPIYALQCLSSFRNLFSFPSHIHFPSWLGSTVVYYVYALWQSLVQWTCIVIKFCSWKFSRSFNKLIEFSPLIEYFKAWNYFHCLMESGIVLVAVCQPWTLIAHSILTGVCKCNMKTQPFAVWLIVSVQIQCHPSHIIFR